MKPLIVDALAEILFARAEFFTKGLGTVNGETVLLKEIRHESNVIRHAEGLDAKYPGSRVLEEKNKYGVNGKCLSLVTGSWETLLQPPFPFRG